MVIDPGDANSGAGTNSTSVIVRMLVVVTAGVVVVLDVAVVVVVLDVGAEDSVELHAMTVPTKNDRARAPEMGILTMAGECRSLRREQRIGRHLDAPEATMIDPTVDASRRLLGNRWRPTTAVDDERRRRFPSHQECALGLADRRRRCRQIQWSEVGAGAQRRLDIDLEPDHRAAPALDELPLPELRRPESQAGRAEPPHDLAARRRLGPEHQRTGASVDIDVVVIPLKADPSTAELPGEIVQFLEVTIGDEMAPRGAAPGPAGLVDQNRHRPTVDGISRSTVRRWHTSEVSPPAEPASTMAPDVISLSIPASPKFVRLVRIGAASIGRRKGLSVRAIDDLRLAVDESFSLLLADEAHHGSVDVTFEVDDHELLVRAVQRLDNGPIPVEPESVVRFEVLLADLVDRFDADPETGVVQFSKSL